jgi:hypothetical protein
MLAQVSVVAILTEISRDDPCELVQSIKLRREFGQGSGHDGLIQRDEQHRGQESSVDEGELTA